MRIRPRGSTSPRLVQLTSPNANGHQWHPDREGRNGPGAGAELLQPEGVKTIEWAVGLTTYKPDEGREGRISPYRRLDLLPKSLASLRTAGFPSPTLFVDGDWDYQSWEKEFRVPVVCRYPRVRAFGNWVLGLAELMVRQPYAQYYAMFQDDILISANTRQYIEQTGYPSDGYLNLYTFPKNQSLAPPNGHGWYKSNQKGLGALGLVFSQPVAVALLSEKHTITRPTNRQRGHKFIDGGVVDALKKVGIWEYVHSPSLIQHTGSKSTLANPRHPIATSFRGGSFDMLSLLKKRDTSENTEG